MNSLFNLIPFGEKLREYRKREGKTTQEAANAMGIDRSYLTKLELAKERPSIRILFKLQQCYSLSEAEATKLAELAGIPAQFVKSYQSHNVAEPIKVDEEQERIFKVVGKREEVGNSSMENTPQTDTQDKKQGIQVSIDGNMPVLYTDSIFVTESSYGIILDFAVNIGPTNQQRVVARIGMSKDHGRALIEILEPRVKSKRNTENRPQN